MNSVNRFSGLAESYSRYRPAYPAECLDALLRGVGDEKRLIVADIGAGTGISTEMLARRVKALIAIEPNVEMRGQAKAVPRISWREATAEQTGLEDNSVDLAVAFQAFHWFDAEAAIAEFKRIARLRIGIVQYERDERQPFAAAYGNTIRPYMRDDTEARRLRNLEWFAANAGQNVVRTAIPFSQELTPEELLGRARSSSYLPQSGPRHDALFGELRELYARFAGDGVVSMAMIAHVLTADLARPSTSSG